MSMQSCPRCCQRSFWWWIDEDVSRLTQLRCGSCGYRALEDESFVSACAECGSDRVRVRLSDPDGEYWYCLSCLSRSAKSSGA
jgi:hypothetical protein